MYQTEPPAAYWREQLFQWGPRVVFAILILIATHFIAKAVQWGIAKLIDRMARLGQERLFAASSPDDGRSSIHTALCKTATAAGRERPECAPQCGQLA